MARRPFATAQVGSGVAVKVSRSPNASIFLGRTPTQVIDAFFSLGYCSSVQ